MKNRVIKQSITYVLILLYIISFIMFLFITYNKNIVRFNKIIIDQNKYDSIIASRQESTDDLIKELSFNNNPLFDVSNTNEFFYSMVEKDNNKYNPYIKYNKDNNLKISILNDYITDELIANNDHIKLLAYNNDYYKEYEIVVTTLPIMNITYDDNEENNNKLQIKDEDVYGNIYLYDNYTNKFESSKLKMHVRGETSSSFPKKGFKLSLKDKYGNGVNKNLLNMRNDDDWILYAGYNDQERIRNVFASKLWYDCCSTNNEFGVAAGMYYKYVELFMNGKYHGLYALGFPIDEKQLDIKDDEVLYQKKYWYEDDDEDVSNTVYEIKSKNSSYKQLDDYIKKINTVDDIDDLYTITDINNQIDFYIYNIFVQNVDGTADKSSKNLYLSFKYNKDNLLKSFYIPWDLDQTFGNVWYEPSENPKYPNMIQPYGVSSDYNENEHNKSSIGKLKVLDNNNIIQKIINRYNDLRNTYYREDYLFDILYKYENDIFKSGAINRDINTWTESSYTGNTNLNIFKNYISNRLNSMDDYINNLKED